MTSGSHIQNLEAQMIPAKTTTVCSAPLAPRTSPPSHELFRQLPHTTGFAVPDCHLASAVIACSSQSGQRNFTPHRLPALVSRSA